MPDEADPLSALRAAIQNLSVQLDQLQQRVAVLERAEVSRAPSQAPSVPPPSVMPSQVPVAAREPIKLESQVGLTMINRVGAVTLAIGIIFFFKYAVDNNWIGPGGRVLIGLLGGFALIGAAGWLRASDQRIFSQGIAGCGLAVLYISLYASFAYYHLVSQGVVFLSMAGASALAIALSLRYSSAAIAGLGFIGAFLTPPLLTHGEDQPWVLYPYLLLLDVVSIAVAVTLRQAALFAIAFFGTAILFPVSIGLHPDKHVGTRLFFLAVFFVLFLVTSARSFALGWPRAGFALVPLNALWTMLSASTLLEAHHATAFAFVMLALGCVHVGYAVSVHRLPRVYTLLYCVGHGCLLMAGVSFIDLWARNNVVAASRDSVINELDSVFIAVYGLVMITGGVLKISALNRIIGLIFLGFVIAKLYCFDVWQLTRFYRISAFIVLGILLLVASYLYSRFKGRVDALLAGKQRSET